MLSTLAYGICMSVHVVIVLSNWEVCTQVEPPHTSTQLHEWWS